jgi:hypothetical protein
MELLESQDPERKQLLETSERHKRALEKEVHDLTKKTERMLTNALIIGGSLALTYFVISSLSGRKKKKKKKAAIAKAQADSGDGDEHFEEKHEDHEPSIVSQIGTRVLSQATVMILDIAKDKLLEYLESRKKADENS